MIFDLFSKRGKKPDTEMFIYDNFPAEFRIQVIHLWSDAIGRWYHETNFYGETHTSPSNKIWLQIHKQLCKEYGIFSLSEQGDNPYTQCQYFIQNATTERVLDIIEMSFLWIDEVVRNWNDSVLQNANITQRAEDAIDELNQRFREHAIGYQYIKGQIVRVDSDYIYKEAVQPAISMLSEEGFEGASQEFMSAHEHFRKGRHKEAISDALKAFESVMKTICKRKGWEVRENATAKPLINTLFQNGLLSISLQTQFSSLRDTLESGLPTIRNKNSGHGQGESIVHLPPHLVAYALHLAATNIVFLIESYKSLD
ncbi:STM4504/CBY_0614 family protein [Paenibacillus sp. 1A_MP2]|uniref:STM4504/CBY_0614 family protein n=1 Tax=Paenibacillus sp. 1A_MP2 TaxID=3457495 RepID=UPI003FCED8CD